MNYNYANEDNIDIFYHNFITRIRDISAKTMKLKNNKIDPDLLDSNICWMVTDNLEGILAIELISEYEAKKQIKYNTYRDINDFNMNLYGYLSDNIRKNYMLIIGQDLNLLDHWFSIIGSNDKAYLFEYQSDKCIGYTEYLNEH